MFTSNAVSRIGALLVLPALLAGQSALAAGSSASNVEVPSVTVHYQDLNLDNPKGVAKLYHRISTAAVTVCKSAEGHGPLRISTLGSFLTQWLMPRLPRFEALHPCIDLRIENSTSLIDFQRSEVHAAVRMGRGTWPGLHSEKLMDEWLVPVCQPALLSKLGPVSDHASLKKYRLIHSSSEPWSVWLLGVPHDDVTARISVDDSAAIVRAAEAGGGLALARWSLVADEVHSGRLAVASQKVIHHHSTYYFVCPPKHRKLPKVAAFHSWLRAEAAKHGAPTGAAIG